MSSKFPTDITSFNASPFSSSATGQQRRPSIDPAELIAAGEEADRKLAWQYGLGGTRPIGDAELQALMARKGVHPLVGVPRPKRLYAVSLSEFNRETRRIDRRVYAVDRHTWNSLVNDAYLGRQVFYQPFEPRRDKPIHVDSISAPTSAGGV